MKGYYPRTTMDNHFFTYEESFGVHAMRERARAGIENFQDRYINEVLEREKQDYSFKKGDFILVRNLAPDLKRGKKLTVQMTGPYLITSISNAVVTAISVKTKKVIRINLDKIYRYRGRISAMMNKMKHDYLQPEDSNMDKINDERKNSNVYPTLDNTEAETNNQADQEEGSSDDDHFDENWDEIMRDEQLDRPQNQLGYDIIWTQANNGDSNETGQHSIKTRNQQKRMTSYEEMISNIDTSEETEDSDTILQEETAKPYLNRKNKINKSEKSRLKEKIQESYEIEETESEEEYLPSEDHTLYKDKGKHHSPNYKVQKRDKNILNDSNWPKDKSNLTTIVQKIN